ncbi:MAG: hypothetical protein IPL32_16215 [Chloracidobacterium sp.]|nr:hypothetical protein [Chloracidobacterium sp.]
MSQIDNFFIRAAFVFVLFASAVSVAFAQTTIFNIPTADTLARGSWNLEGDFIAKPTRYSEGGYQTYGYRVAYGLNHKTEIGSNFYHTWNGDNSTGQVEFSVKRKIYESEKHGFSISAGTVLFVPLKSVAGDRTSVMVYGNARKTINSLGGMTATGGVYSVFRGPKEFGTRTGAMVGVVQPINKKVSFVADWFSGNNRLGYASAGVNFNITSRQYLLTGYSFGNSGRGNNALAAYYGLTF